jgi:ribonuclease HII
MFSPCQGDKGAGLLNTQQRPSFIEEEELLSRGIRLIAGVDEVGRGSIAGPVVAAAVIMPDNLQTPWLAEVRDSKLLRPTKREILANHIKRTAISFGVGVVNQRRIDTLGIVRASKLAMKLAIESLSPGPEHLLIDYLYLPEVPLPQKGITDGDCICFSIACASIVAKVARDEMMVRLDQHYPGYRLAENKGYCTEEHLVGLSRLGPSPIHRRTFQPVRRYIWQVP